VLTVADTGIGMSEAEVAIALAPFGQIDSAYTRRHDGTGLGLPLARRLAELLGGGLALESVPGSGTTATVTIPMEAADAPREIAGAAYL
jgi:two-component system cell cycle sensor histidine kinase PleC